MIHPFKERKALREADRLVDLRKEAPQRGDDAEASAEGEAETRDQIDEEDTFSIEEEKHPPA